VLAEPDPARRLRGAASWLRTLYAAGFDVVMIFEAATDESAETRALLQPKLARRNQAMDAMIVSLDGHLRAPVRQVQAVYRALAAPGSTASWWRSPAGRRTSSSCGSATCWNATRWGPPGRDG
jgi:hypothetical protein